MIDFFFLHFHKISVGVMIFAFFASWIKNIASRKNNSLERLMAVSLTSTAMPTSLALMLCAFDQKLIQKLDDISVNLAASGLIVLYVSIRSMKDDF